MLPDNTNIANPTLIIHLSTSGGAVSMILGETTEETTFFLLFALNASHVSKD